LRRKIPGRSLSAREANSSLSLSWQWVDIVLESLDHRVFTLLSAPLGPSGGVHLLALVLAQWAIFIGPALLVLIWVTGGKRDRFAAVRACLTTLLALAIAGATSSLYFHPRPFMDGIAQNYLHHAPDSSFPSDHATLLFAIGWSLLIVRPTILRLIWIVPTSLALAVGWSRVYLGAHYPLDVVGAAIIALASASCFASSVGCRATAALTSYGERIYEWPLSVFRSDC